MMAWMISLISEKLLIDLVERELDFCSVYDSFTDSFVAMVTENRRY